jgi:hypothetical protein
VLFQRMKDCIVSVVASSDSVVMESEIFDDNEVNDNENPSMEVASRLVPPPPSHPLSSTFCPSQSPLPSVTNGPAKYLILRKPLPLLLRFSPF